MNIIWDLDGTLTDPSPFVHLISSAPKDWDRWDENIINHEPHWDMVHLFKTHFLAGHTNFIVTARRENCRNQTEEWLRKYELEKMHNGLYMRAMTDFRPDFETKQDILFELRRKGYDINLAFEDRVSVAEMFRANGVRCLHVCAGEY